MSPDITLCCWRYPDCPLAPSCHRALAEPCDDRQSYFAPDSKGPRCPYYIKEEPKDEEQE